MSIESLAKATRKTAVIDLAQLDPATTLILMPEVESIVGLARPTIYKLMRQTESGFPLPVKLSDSTARGAPVAWVLSEVHAWAPHRQKAQLKTWAFFV